jgi:hypothetical protein
MKKFFFSLMSSVVSVIFVGCDSKQKQTEQNKNFSYSMDNTRVEFMGEITEFRVIDKPRNNENHDFGIDRSDLDFYVGVPSASPRGADGKRYIILSSHPPGGNIIYWKEENGVSLPHLKAQLLKMEDYTTRILWVALQHR